MKRYIVSVSALLCGLFCVQAETLTLDECRSRALEYNKSLVSSRLQIQKQEADLKAMKTNFLPNFKVYAADFYNTGKITPNS
ncbi:MAG: TolC family protein, partial [Bacteroidaceae bacterium]|nr:TolC family protein [Bacteroidaceae bacterium]